MHATKYIMWEEEGRWHGHLKDYPDILAQAESFEDLQIKLSLLHRELTGSSDFHVQPPPHPYPMPRRLATNPRLEQLLSLLLKHP